MDEPTLAILRAADDPVHAESPPNFDWQAGLARLQAVKPELEHIAQNPFWLDSNVQDATFFAELSIRRPAGRPNHFDTLLALRFSAFGSLFTAWPHPTAQHIAPRTLQRVIAAVERHGFVYIEASQLDTPYTGCHPAFGAGTWWQRFFDWR